MSRSIVTSTWYLLYFENYPCFWSKHEVWLTGCVAAGSLYAIFFSPCCMELRWSSAGSIILASRSPGSGITACQLRVKYFSTTTPLFFTSGSTDVSLVQWPFTYRACWVKKGEGGHIKKGCSARREEEEMFLCVILHMWSSWRSVSMNSLSAPKGKHFSTGIWGMKPEVLCFDPCALPPLHCPPLAPLAPDSRAWGRDW